MLIDGKAKSFKVALLALRVLHYEHDPWRAPRVRRVKKALPDSLSPFLGKIKFYGMSISKAVATRTVRHDDLCFASGLSTPLFLIPSLRVEVPGLGHKRQAEHQEDCKRATDEPGHWLRAG